MDVKSQGSGGGGAIKEDKYAAARRKRQERTDEVILSPSNKKIVVAGPGTGKTHLFKRILEGKKHPLALTFVNSLVEDLSLDLCGLSEVRTLHSFARSVLGNVSGEPIEIFPLLPKVIREDARILLNEEIDFDSLFHNREDGNENLAFYEKRRSYYDHYGYSDIVFNAVRHLEQHSDKVPAYGQVVVDEFQDFNTLEVSLIDLLAEKNPTLLVGDDDQALYESLKSASPKHIRQRHSDLSTGYAPFDLPYCSRCTRVIVEAFNDIIIGATNDGHLASRIQKPFLYFDEEKKDKESDANPLLVYRQKYAAQIPWFIQKCIGEIAEEVKDKFTVLIICPTKIQCKSVVAALREKRFETVGFVEKQNVEKPRLLDGLKLLLENPNCNLGWRIVADHLLESTIFGTIVKKTDEDNAERIQDLIDTGKRKEVAQMLKVLRAVRDGKDTDEVALAALLKKLGIDAYAMAKDFLSEGIKSSIPGGFNPGIGKTPITVTTIQSAKGLDADYVFITHFDDQYFIKDKDKSKVSDQDICNFLVVLTRARKKVFLISSNAAKRPTFLNWIDAKRIDWIRSAGGTGTQPND